MNNLTNISPIDGRYYNKTSKLREYFSEYSLIRDRVEIEIEWFRFLSEQNSILEIPKFSSKAKNFLENIIFNFNISDAEEIKNIESITNHDVKAVEYWLKSKIAINEELHKHKEFIHFGCTSEDINNIAYAIALHNTRQNIILPEFKSIIDKIIEISIELSDNVMISRTHGQPASPSTMGKEFANFANRLNYQSQKLASVNILAKINGAVGNFNTHSICYPDVNWILLTEEFLFKFSGIGQNLYTTQIEPHDYMAEYFQCLIRFNNILIDLCQDIWQYISLGYFKLKVISGEVGSSTMPHKVNPIDFENAEGNLGLSNALLNHLSMKLPISRLQRDLSDSTTLRSIGSAIAYAFIAYQSILIGLNKLEINQDKLYLDLDNNWEILAEPLQMVMKKYGIDSAYEQLKEFTRNKQISKNDIRMFISSLEIPYDVKSKLLNLTPETYYGYAPYLAKQIEDLIS